MADPVPFADANDYTTRTGQTLTVAETSQVNVLLGEASELIREASPGIDERVAAGSPALTLVVGICVRMVTRYLANPAQAASMTTGPFTTSWASDNARGMWLSDEEKAILDGTVGLTTTGRRTVGTIRVGQPVGTARNGPWTRPWR